MVAAASVSSCDAERGIPLFRSNGDSMPGNAFSDVQTSSNLDLWNNLVVQQHRIAPAELTDLRYSQHVVSVNVGGPIECEFIKDGRWQRIAKRIGSVSIFPRNSLFRRRMNRTATVLYMALSPSLLEHIWDESEYRSFELLEMKRDFDGVLLNMAQMLREASMGPLRNDPLFGNAVSLALSRYLLTSYSSGHPSQGAKNDTPLSEHSLRRVIDYVQSHLGDSRMTVSSMARVANISQFHFTRLFKVATGATPYQFVITSRVQRAKSLLSSTKTPLKEIACLTGFADQSHLTRHFKRVVGVSPKRFSSAVLGIRDKHLDLRERVSIQ